MSGLSGGVSTGVGLGGAMRAGFDNGVITRHLARLAIADSQGFNAARREIGETLLGDVQDNLDGQKLFDGSAMPQSKAAIKRSGKTLIKKHHLYDSYVYQLEAGGVAVGSNRAYARIHHFGGSTGRGGRTRIDARPVMGMGARQERAIGDVLIAEIARLA
jgi:phage virion morphogenesis protein